MRQVWKFPIASGIATAIQLAPDARLAMVGMDPSSPHVALWFEVDTAPRRRSQRNRHFTIIPTGRDIPAAAKHIGSVRDGEFVWHVYELAS